MIQLNQGFFASLTSNSLLTAITETFS